MIIVNCTWSVQRGSLCWLLFGSLLMNLLIIGVTAAMMIAEPASPHRQGDLLVRIDRLATTLPPADADVLQTWFDFNKATIQDNQEKFNIARIQTEKALQRKPFDIQLLRAAMEKSRIARQNFDQVISDIFVAAVAQMSPAGRHAIAEWSRSQKFASTK